MTAGIWPRGDVTCGRPGPAGRRRPAAPISSSDRGTGRIAAPPVQPRQPSIWLRMNRIGISLTGIGRHRSSVRASETVDLTQAGNPTPAVRSATTRDKVLEYRAVDQAQAPFVPVSAAMTSVWPRRTWRAGSASIMRSRYAGQLVETSPADLDGGQMVPCAREPT